MKTQRSIGSLLALLTVLFFTSCDPEEKPTPVDSGANVIVKTVYGDEPFVLGQVYTDPLGHRIRIDAFKGYISGLTLHGEQGSKQVKDFILNDFTASSSFTVNMDPGQLDSITFGLGVPQDYNLHVDPSTYANSHPLSVQGAQGMFWSWNTGYIFVKLEGKADLEGVEGNPLLDPIAFHIGDNPNYRSVTLPCTKVLGADGKETIQIIVDVKQVLFNPNDQFDLATEYITHTSDNATLATRFINNMTSAFTIQ